MFMLEDAAHAHGSRINGKMAGNLADGGAFSFFPTKVMTTCEGGIIVTNDQNEDYLARSFRNQGKRGVNYGNFHEDFGNSSRMTEIHALIGSIQLQKLPKMLKARQDAYKIISKQLREAGISFVSADHMDAASQYKIIIHLPDGADLKETKAALAKDGVILGGGVYEMPCHVQPVFKGLAEVESYPGADQWCPRHICPPVTSATTPELAQYIGETLVKHLGAHVLETAGSSAA
jgi:perosamine synthetase